MTSIRLTLERLKLRRTVNALDGALYLYEKGFTLDAFGLVAIFLASARVIPLLAIRSANKIILGKSA